MNKRYSNAEQKERIRQRVRVQIDEENYEFFPERKDPDYYDNDVNQRVGVYVRVSTDDPRQTTSYELQKKYYEDFVVRHPKWTLVDIYADEYNRRMIQYNGVSTPHKRKKAALKSRKFLREPPFCIYSGFAFARGVRSSVHPLCL